MTASRNLLVFGGIALAAFGMSYGLHYALFVEHQTLDRMGGSLMQAFVRAAERQMPQAHDAIGTYASAKYDYVRQVDVHSHWTGLAMLMIVLGIAFDGVAFSERVRTWIAGSLLGGSVLFPFGVILQTASPIRSCSSKLFLHHLVTEGQAAQRKKKHWMRATVHVPLPSYRSCARHHCRGIPVSGRSGAQETG